jgi:hypothetical protein
MEEKMQNNPTPETSAPEAAPPSDPLLSKHLEAVEALVQDFRRLLVRYESSLEAEGIRERIETLERWAESYRRGLRAAEKISEVGQDWLREAEEKLKLAAAELHRLDDESPVSCTVEDSKAEDYIRATKRIDSLIPAVGQAVDLSEEAVPKQEERKKEPAE